MSFSEFANASLIIQIHMVAALLAMVIGPIALLRKRRDRLHKTSGYVWVVLMVVTAASSFFIFELRIIGVFSPIHLLSVLTFVGLGLGIWFIKTKQIAQHQRVMWRLYSQSIGIAGLFTFLPGRLMNDIFTFASPWTIFFVAFGVFAGGGVLIYREYRNGVL